MTISIRQCMNPSPNLVAKQYDQGEYEYFDVMGDDNSCFASFAIGERGERALVLWTFHQPSAIFFRSCHRFVLPFVKKWCKDRGCSTLMSATGDPERDPDFDRVSSFFGFKPVLRTAAMEI